MLHGTGTLLLTSDYYHYCFRMGKVFYILMKTSWKDFLSVWWNRKEQNFSMTWQLPGDAW